MGVASRMWPPEDRESEREKLAAGPGSREFRGRHETNNCGELRVRWGGLGGGLKSN